MFWNQRAHLCWYRRNNEFTLKNKNFIIYEFAELFFCLWSMDFAGKFPGKPSE